MDLWKREEVLRICKDKELSHRLLNTISESVVCLACRPVCHNYYRDHAILSRFADRRRVSTGDGTLLSLAQSQQYDMF